MNDRFIEDAPGPFGMERVVAEGLEGYRALPNAPLGIVNRTLHAIATDPRPKEMLMDFLAKPPSEKNAAKMLEALNRFEEQFTPPDRRTVLTGAQVEQIWENEQGMIGGLVYALLDEEQAELPLDERYFSAYLTVDQMAELQAKLPDAELPFDTIAFVTDAYSRALKDPAVARDVFALRAALRNDPDGAEEVYQNLLNRVWRFVNEFVSDSEFEGDQEAILIAYYLINYVATE